MDALVRDRRIRSFKATDAFAFEAYRISRTLHTAHRSLADEICRTAVRCGGALVAASGSEPGGLAEQKLLARARATLLEGRYYLYLARRLGLLDLKSYRGLTGRQDIAIREVEALLRRPDHTADRAPDRTDLLASSRT